MRPFTYHSNLHRRGSAMVYLLVCMPFMVLTASLAVDYGRAQTAKTQLQAVVDAAARVAAEDLVNFQPTSTACADAIALAAANKVDGQPVVLQASDIVFGTWTPGPNTFSPNSSSPNAVQITACRSASRGTAIPTMMASVVGSASVDIHATATIYVTQGMAPFNANGNVIFNDTGLSNGGSWTTDSYVGNTTAYSAMSARGNGHLLTNGNVTYNFVTPAGAQSGWDNMINNCVMGTVYSANGQDCQMNWSQNSTAGGTFYVQYGGWNNPGPSTQGLGTTTSFPTPVMPTHNTNPAIPSAYLSGSNSNGLSDLAIADGSMVTLPGGTYTLNSLSISNGSTVTFSGPVTLNIATNVDINAAAIQGSINDPKYLVMNVCNTGSAGINHVNINSPTQSIYADLNAPLADLNFTQPNNGNGFYGRMFANNMTVNSNGNGGFHGDESLLMQFHIVR